MPGWRKHLKQIDRMLLSLNPSTPRSEDDSSKMMDLTRKIANSVLLRVEQVRKSLRKQIKVKKAKKKASPKPVKHGKDVIAKTRSVKKTRSQGRR